MGKTIYPSEGYKYLTNGIIFASCVTLGRNDSEVNWHDTNDEPPEPPEPVDPETQELADLVEESYELCNEIIGG